jgi:hypothetical protein
MTDFTTISAITLARIPLKTLAEEGVTASSSISQI